jgi:hypothetical protein
MKDTKAEFKIGDLVYYRPSQENFYANSSKQMGVVLDVIRDPTPLIHNFPEKKYFEYEYTIKWIVSGFTSRLLGFNLEKVKIPKKNA